MKDNENFIPYEQFKHLVKLGMSGADVADAILALLQLSPKVYGLTGPRKFTSRMLKRMTVLELFQQGVVVVKKSEVEQHPGEYFRAGNRIVGDKIL